MTKNNYKRLGDFIQRVDVRNTENEDLPLMGVSVQKHFIPSIANTVGTDFKKYKIVERNQFTYIPDTSRRGDKIGVALFYDYDKGLVSQAYTTFEIVDFNELHPEYLMMWFRRPEFDRYARYHSIGSVREVFDWNDMCDVELPVPSIEKQREIVQEYQAVEKRIALNEELIAKLEETAQAVYREWFVEFEFPDEDGKPYKSNGGKMVWNEELEKDVPEGWEVKSLKKITKTTLGGDWGKELKQGNYIEEVYCIRGTDIPNINRYNFEDCPTRYILSKNLKNRRLKAGHIVIEISGGSPTQSTGRITLINSSHLEIINKPIICSNFCRVIDIEKDYSLIYKFELINNYENGLFFTYENGTHGVKNLDLNSLIVDLNVCSHPQILDSFNEITAVIENKLFLLGIEIQKLEELKDLLLTRMMK